MKITRAALAKCVQVFADNDGNMEESLRTIGIEVVPVVSIEGLPPGAWKLSTSGTSTAWYVVDEEGSEICCAVTQKIGMALTAFPDLIVTGIDMIEAWDRGKLITLDQGLAFREAIKKAGYRKKDCA